MDDYGTFAQGGYVVLKKDHIPNFSKEKGYDDKDYRTVASECNNNKINKEPLSADDANKYFPLPLAGFYYSGTLNYMDEIGFYWSSSAYPQGGGNAYRLYFSKTNIDVKTGSRINGAKAQKVH